MTEEQEWFSTGEAAKKLGVSFRTIKRWIYSGKIQEYRKTIGGHYRIPKAEIERLLHEARDQHALDILNLIDKRKVVYLREVQVNLEKRYTHIETRDKLNFLIERGDLNTNFSLGRRWYFPKQFSWNDVEYKAREKLSLVETFVEYERSFEKNGIRYQDYSEYLVERALIIAGCTVVAKDTYYFNGRVVLLSNGRGRPHDLDFIVETPQKVYVGVQVKNRLEYPKYDNIRSFIELCQGLNLKPLLITRQAHPMTFDHLRRLGGWVVVTKQVLLKPGFPPNVLKALREQLGIPVAVYMRAPEYLVREIIRAIDAISGSKL